MSISIINRSQNDNCMLCRKNKATKTKSHILSKFLGKELKKNNKNHFTAISSNLENKKEQDLPKLDYLYCPECEKKFEVIETEVSRLLLQINDIKFINNFQNKVVNNEGFLTSNKLLEPSFLLLFIYIQMWRAASLVNNFFDKVTDKTNSDYKLFEFFRLDKNIEEQLHEILIENLFLQKQELLSNIEQIKTRLPFYQFALFTHSGKISNGSRFFYANTSDDYTATLCLNDFKLVMFFNNKVPEGVVPFANTSIKDANIAVLYNNIWTALTKSFQTNFRNWNSKN